jgi:antitoxin PrlF
MNIHRSKLVDGGRLEIPADIRQQLGLNDGDPVILEVVDNELRVRNLTSALKRVQERLKPYAPEGMFLSDELIAERRAEAARE